MASISLAKAMKVKNRLAGRLEKTKNSIANYNSVLESHRLEVDVLALDKLRSEIIEALIQLKTAIASGSQNIQQVIYRLSEKKGEITFLNGLNTRNGTEPAYGLRAEPQNYVAAIKLQDVASRVKKLEAEIDELQDELDAYNATPGRIQINSHVLELAS